MQLDFRAARATDELDDFLGHGRGPGPQLGGPLSCKHFLFQG
ncbi:hypothetical protein ACPCVO_50115 [Streptomyces umbrinus]